MHIVVKAGAQQKQEFLSKGFADEVQVSFLDNENTIPGADAYFDLCYEENGPSFSAITDKPVFVNAVVVTNKELPGNCSRINAWDGFLKREIVEIVAANLPAGGQGSQINDTVFIMNALKWRYQLVADVPGMIAARVIAMIINEAYFGLGDEISTKAEIDIAMKLGTNHPYGPFEWSEKIGLQKIYALLKKLSENDNRYDIAPALEKEVFIK